MKVYGEAPQLHHMWGEQETISMSMKWPDIVRSSLDTMVQ